MTFLRLVALPALLLAVADGSAAAQIGLDAPMSVESPPPVPEAVGRWSIVERDRRLDEVDGVFDREPQSRTIELRAPRRQTMAAGAGLGAVLGVGAFLLTSGGCYENEEDPCSVGPVTFVVGGAAIGAIVGAVLGE